MHRPGITGRSAAPEACSEPCRDRSRCVPMPASVLAYASGDAEQLRSRHHQAHPAIVKLGRQSLACIDQDDRVDQWNGDRA